MSVPGSYPLWALEYLIVSCLHSRRHLCNIPDNQDIFMNVIPSRGLHGEGLP